MNTYGKPTAAIWSRVSTDEQDNENQLDVLREVAARRGFEIVKVYAPKESAYSGTKLKVALDGALRDAQRGEFSYLFCWALDRLSRQGALDTLQLLNSFSRAGVTVSSHQEPWAEMGGELAELMIPVVAWMAKMESRRKSERVKAAMARRKKLGLPVGRQPGAVDKKPRKRSGYVARWERERAEAQ